MFFGVFGCVFNVFLWFLGEGSWGTFFEYDLQVTSNRKEKSLGICFGRTGVWGVDFWWIVFWGIRFWGSVFGEPVFGGPVFGGSVFGGMVFGGSVFGGSNRKCTP